MYLRRISLPAAAAVSEPDIVTTEPGGRRTAGKIPALLPLLPLISLLFLSHTLPTLATAYRKKEQTATAGSSSSSSRESKKRRGTLAFAEASRRPTTSISSCVGATALVAREAQRY